MFAKRSTASVWRKTLAAWGTPCRCGLCRDGVVDRRVRDGYAARPVRPAGRSVRRVPGAAPAAATVHVARPTIAVAATAATALFTKCNLASENVARYWKAKKAYAKVAIKKMADALRAGAAVARRHAL